MLYTTSIDRLLSYLVVPQLPIKNILWSLRRCPGVKLFTCNQEDEQTILNTGMVQGTLVLVCPRNELERIKISLEFSFTL